MHPRPRGPEAPVSAESAGAAALGGAGPLGVRAQGRRGLSRQRPHSGPRDPQQQLPTWMQRVSSSLSKESKLPSRSPSAALSPQNPGSSQQLGPCKDVLPTSWDNACGGADFQMKVDAQGFAPEELMVEVDGQWLLVTGQRQVEGCSSDGGGFFMQQKVQRQMQLPPNLDPNAVTCNMTPSGCLHIQGQSRALPCSQNQSPPPLPSKHRNKGSKK